MNRIQIYYVTNRRHRGPDRWAPTGYGIETSKDGMENLRFGTVTVRCDEDKVSEYLEHDGGFGTGDGLRLARYFLDQRRDATIEAFREDLRKEENEATQQRDNLGSTRAFSELRDQMDAGDHVLIFVHGSNVKWWEGVASAASLQCMLNRHCSNEDPANDSSPVRVVLFSWPSDGRAVPHWSYFSDRSDAKISGYALGRGLLKLRDYLIQTSREKDRRVCQRSVYLLCHSMGNFVLQHALKRLAEFSVGSRLPRLFERIFLCAADVASDVFQPGQPFHRLPELARAVTIYHNSGDLTMPLSDYTKGNSDRLGRDGAEWPSHLPDRIHQVDCSRLVSGLVEHSYYHCGAVNDDIRYCIDGVPPDSRDRTREPVRHGWPNVWRLVGE